SIDGIPSSDRESLSPPNTKRAFGRCHRSVVRDSLRAVTGRNTGALKVSIALPTSDHVGPVMTIIGPAPSADDMTLVTGPASAPGGSLVSILSRSAAVPIATGICPT